MALSIGTNDGAMRASQAASIAARGMEASMERLSTGKRINSASDDAAGVAISSRLSAEVRHNTHEITGLTLAHSRIPGMSIIHRIVRRVIARHTMGLAAQVRASEESKVRLLEIMAEQSQAHVDTRR